MAILDIPDLKKRLIPLRKVKELEESNDELPGTDRVQSAGPPARLVRDLKAEPVLRAIVVGIVPFHDYFGEIRVDDVHEAIPADEPAVVQQRWSEIGGARRDEAMGRPGAFEWLFEEYTHFILEAY